MIKKMRRKFIIAAMLAVTAVLTVIIGGMITVNYFNLVSTADTTIDMILSNDGRFPRAEFSPDKKPFEHKPFSPETPFETRYFTVRLDREGNPVVFDIDFVAAIDISEAEEMAKNVFLHDESSGFYSNYRFGLADTEKGSIIVFLDCFRSLSTFRSFAFSGIFISVIGLAAVFILVLIFSGVIVRPIAESYEKQRRFITDASHEIKTPLAIISANAEVIEAENGESEWTNSIKNQVENLSGLTQNLITLSRMEEGKEPAMNNVSLSQIVIESLEPFYTLASSKDKMLTTHIDADISVIGNDPMLRQLVSILADNAVKYSNENAEIIVSLKKQGRGAVLSFENTVDGISTGNHDRLFDRFVRSDNSRNSKTGGHGIGLSVAKAIAETHKAIVSAFSPNGKILNISIIFR
ncbi:MAG: HAMP domain-containing histidine kinase [Clostridia bacterium]|nr:HAMP domain-containing histidine kinase [Clostridia bacterium]